MTAARRGALAAAAAAASPPPPRSSRPSTSATSAPPSSSACGAAAPPSLVPRDLGPAVLPGDAKNPLRISCATRWPRTTASSTAATSPPAAPPPRRRRRRPPAHRPTRSRRSSSGCRGGAREGRRPEPAASSFARAHEEHRAGELAPGEGPATALSDASWRLPARSSPGERRPPREGAPRAHRDPVAVRRLGSFPQAFAYVRQQLATPAYDDDARSPALTDAERRGDGDGRSTPSGRERLRPSATAVLGHAQRHRQDEGSSPNLAPMLAARISTASVARPRARRRGQRLGRRRDVGDGARARRRGKPERSVVFAGWAGEEREVTGPTRARTHLEEGGGSRRRHHHGRGGSGAARATRGRCPDLRPPRHRPWSIPRRSFRSIAGPTTRVDVSIAVWLRSYVLAPSPTRPRHCPRDQCGAATTRTPPVVGLDRLRRRHRLRAALLRGALARRRRRAVGQPVVRRRRRRRRNKAPTGHALEARSTVWSDLARIEGRSRRWRRGDAERLLSNAIIWKLTHTRRPTCVRGAGQAALAPAL